MQKDQLGSCWNCPGEKRGMSKLGHGNGGQTKSQCKRGSMHRIRLIEILLEKSLARGSTGGPR